MSQDQMNPSRHWRQLAEATAKEQDPVKLAEKVQQLIRALEFECKKPVESDRNEDGGEKRAG
jgi:hypothetical protein